MIAWKTENFSLIILELKLGNNIMIKKYYDRRIKMKKIKKKENKIRVDSLSS